MATLYKYYAAQTPLAVTEAELEDVVNAVVNPQNTNTRMLASKVLLKIFIDIFLSSRTYTNAGAAIQGVIFELVTMPGKDLDVPSAIHAFNLVYNLASHLELYAPSMPIQLGSESTSLRSLDPHSVASLACAGADIGSMQEVLFGMASQAASLALLRGHTSLRVWACFLNLLLLLGSDNGEIIPLRASSLDPRVIVYLMTHLPHLSASVEAVLARMLLFALYEGPGDPEASDVSYSRLDTARLALVSLMFAPDAPSPLAPVLSLYERCGAHRGASSLFRIIFDFSVLQVASSGALGSLSLLSSAVGNVWDLLVAFEAPLVFRSLFRFVAPKFVERFLRHVFFDQLKDGGALSTYARSLDKTLIVALLYQIEKLAAGHVVVDSRLTPASSSSAQAMVESLLASSNARDNANGIALMVSMLSSRSKKEASLASPILTRLMGSGSSSLLVQAVTIVTRVASILRAEVDRLEQDNAPNPSPSGETPSLAAYFGFLNAWLSTFVRAVSDSPTPFVSALSFGTSTATKTKGEQQRVLVVSHSVQQWVIRSLVEVLLDQIAVPVSSQWRSAVDGVDAFLSGSAVIPRDIVRLIDIRMVHGLFAAADPRSLTPHRAALLSLVVAKVRHSGTLEAIGGMGFFTDLLDDPDPSVAYLAGRHLVDELRVEKPAQFGNLVKKLHARWSGTPLAGVSSNEWVLIKGVLKLRAEKKRA